MGLLDPNLVAVRVVLRLLDFDDRDALAESACERGVSEGLDGITAGVVNGGTSIEGADLDDPIHQGAVPQGLVVVGEELDQLRVLCEIDEGLHSITINRVLHVTLAGTDRAKTALDRHRVGELEATVCAVSAHPVEDELVSLALVKVVLRGHHHLPVGQGESLCGESSGLGRHRRVHRRNLQSTIRSDCSDLRTCLSCIKGFDDDFLFASNLSPP